MDHYLGFDLGGTKMLAALFDESNTVRARNKERTPVGMDSKELLAAVKSTIDAALDKADILKSDLSGIGMTIPGPIRYPEGIVLNTPNIGLRDFPMKKELEKMYKVPVLVENDVNAGVYGEFRFGAAQGFRNIIGLFPGTGIGGGLILDGKLYRGAFGGAAEIGHMIIQVDGRLCGCGRYGCLEAMASKTAIAKDLVWLGATGGSPSTLDQIGTDLGKVKSKVIAKAVDDDEAEVKRLVLRAAEFLGIGAANCINIFNPELIILGGGLVEKLGKFYLDAVEKSMRVHAMPHLQEGAKLFAAGLGDDAVIFGVNALLREELEGAGDNG